LLTTILAPLFESRSRVRLGEGRRRPRASVAPLREPSILVVRFLSFSTILVKISNRADGA
jgi:hypothetical protein